MKNEKVAIFILALIIIGAITIYLVSIYYPTIIDNLFGEEITIEDGYLADVQYVGKYASNGTVFYSTYEDPINKTGGEPEKVFVDPTKEKTVPEGYDDYSSDYVEGFLEGLVGLKTGQSATIGPIPPEKGYGANKLDVGDIFSMNITTFSYYGYAINQTMEVIGVNDNNVTIKWININENEPFTLPEGVLFNETNLAAALYTYWDTQPPFFLWEGATDIINVSDDYIEVYLNITKSNISSDILLITYDNKIGIYIPDVTTVTYNDTSVVLETIPAAGANYTFELQGMTYNLSINNVTNGDINSEIISEGQSYPVAFNTTFTFDRYYNMPITYTIPRNSGFFSALDYYLNLAGISTNPLAGQELIFEVHIDKVYRPN